MGISAGYVFCNFGKISFEQVLFIDETVFVMPWVKMVATIIIVGALTLTFIVINYTNTKTKIVLSAMLLMFTIFVFSILEYVIYNISYSDFYEKNYKHAENIIFPKTKRNLIIIYLESMERDYKGQKTKPFLDSLEKNNISFDGFKQLDSTNATIGAHFGSLCGLPLKKVLSTNDLINFFPDILCVPDILNSNGYYTSYLKAADVKFSEAGHLASQHSFDNIKGYLELKDDLLKKFDKINGNYFGGLSDRILFEAAKDELNRLKQPFLLVLTTLDMHGVPDYFVDEHCNKTFDDVRDAVRCVDKNVESFLMWLKKQKFYENTTIILVGDHIGNRSSKNAQIFNVFINTPENLKPQKHRWTTYDLAPTILESIGVKTPSLGMGRSLFEIHPTLLEKYENNFNFFLMAKNKLYESFADKFKLKYQYRPYKISTVIKNQQISDFAEISYNTWCYMTPLVSMNIGYKPKNDLILTMDIKSLAYPFDILFNGYKIYSNIEYLPKKENIRTIIDKDMINDSGNVLLEIKMREYNRNAGNGICIDNFSLNYHLAN